MKKLIYVFVLFVLSSSAIFSQNNIVNTLGSGGVFSIKCGATTYLSLSQSNGLLDLNSSIRLPSTTSSSTGVIYKGADRFLHNYGYANTFLGINSGNFTMTGYSNTGVGCNSLFSNENGRDNTAIGSGSLILIKTGYENTAVGSNSLHNHNGLFATAIGCNSMASNTTGYQNTAVGAGSLLNNTTGGFNTSLGVATLFYNIIGSQNTAVGQNSLYSNTTGSNNTAIGYQSACYVTTGTNITCIGADAYPSSNTISNEITLGNGSISTLRCNTSTITSLSDARDKKNINDLNLGIDFLMKVKPRIYNWDKREWYDKNVSDGTMMQDKLTAGFIAQELDEVQTSENAEWLNLVLKNNPEKLETTPGNLMPVMVKAIQELKTENDDLKTRVIALEQNSGTTNKQTAGFLSGIININFLLLLVFSTVGFAFFLIKRYSNK